MDPMVAYQCQQCGAEYFPEDLRERAHQTSLGGDVVVAVHCECGYGAILSWHVVKWNAMQKARQRQLDEWIEREEQRERSRIGREVADFRRTLERIDTLADIGWSA